VGDEWRRVGHNDEHLLGGLKDIFEACFCAYRENSGTFRPADQQFCNTSIVESGHGCLRKLVCQTPFGSAPLEHVVTLSSLLSRRSDTKCPPNPRRSGAATPHYETRYIMGKKFSQSRFEREYRSLPNHLCRCRLLQFPSVPYLEALGRHIPNSFQLAFKVTDAITIKNYPNLPHFVHKGENPNEHFLNVDLFKRALPAPCDHIRDKIGVLIFKFSHFHQRTLPMAESSSTSQCWYNGSRCVLSAEAWGFGVGGSLSPSQLSTIQHAGSKLRKSSEDGLCVDWARAVASDMSGSFFIGHRHTYGGFSVPHWFEDKELSRHAYVLGKSGTGKSTLLQLLIGELVRSGKGFAVIDPHGSLAEWTLHAVPQERLDDVVYLDFADPAFAPSLNLVSDSIPHEARPRLAAALVSAFRHIWAESWGPRLEHILYHSLRVLIDAQNASLIALPRLLTDDAYRAWAVRQCRDPFIRAFWSQEFDAWDKRFRAEAIAPVLNKLGQLVAFPPVRQSLGQVRMKVDVREILMRRKILVVNLAKGRLGEDASRLLGALLTALLSATAMERGDLTADAPAFTLVLDEAHCFLSEAMETVLSEARKFGLRLVLAHQFLEQLSPKMRAAVLGNAGSIFAFRLSAQDARIIAENFGASFAAQQFIELAPRSAIFKGSHESGEPVRLSLAAVCEKKSRYLPSIVARSRQRFCSLRKDVEERLERWLREP